MDDPVRLKVEIGRLLSRRHDLIIEIGQRVYALYAQGRTIPEVGTLCREAHLIHDRAKDLADAIESRRS